MRLREKEKEKEEELQEVRAENEQLRQLLAQALARIAELEAKVQELQQALAEAKSAPPSFVKPSTPKPEAQAEKKPRRKRAKGQNGARRREQTPTRIVEHKLQHCPDCAYPLQHPQLEDKGKRQVIELPPPQPVEVTEHQLYKSWCPRCSRWYRASVDLSGQVIGQSRIEWECVSPR